ncbi:MAG TPA: 3-dehydroquinate synthase [Lacunisphaera sp.]|jgi:3-dehydroquinate synthase
MTQGLTVELGQKSYPIHFVQNAGDEVAKALKQFGEEGRSSALLTDEGVARAQGTFLARHFAGSCQLTVVVGEKAKSLEVFGQVLDFLASNRVARQGILWVVGGGVPGDLGGYAAASYLRGIDYMQVPTTLLAMVDSSVGGKTGLNLSAGKNLVGAFHHPRAVIIATDFLQTLPPREFAAGSAEIIKYGLLGDVALFDRLEKTALTPASADLAAVIRRCCEMKAEIVRADEREMSAEGGRALLNLGHTFGHAIEQVTGFKSYLHGEAVGVGLAAAARLSQKLGYLTPADVERVDRTVAAHQLPVRLKEPLPLPALTESMQHDKKVRAGKLRFVVLKCLGEAATQTGIEPALVEAVWRELGAA